MESGSGFRSPVESMEVRDHIYSIMSKACNPSKIFREVLTSSFNTKVIIFSTVNQTAFLYLMLFIPIWCHHSYSCEPPFFSLYLVHMASISLLIPLCIWRDSFCLIFSQTFISFIVSLTLLFLFTSKVSYHYFRVDLFVCYLFALCFSMVNSGAWCRSVLSWAHQNVRKEMEGIMMSKFDEFQGRVEDDRIERVRRIQEEDEEEVVQQEEGAEIKLGDNEE